MKIADEPEDYWRKKLPPAVYHITREKGTEPAFSGVYLDNKKTGMYHCVACGSELFSSEAKFDSGTGWPSFTDVVNSAHILVEPDESHGMHRMEVVCAHCGSHLGHVFDDGPIDRGGARYCINSLALDFREAPERSAP